MEDNQTVSYAVSNGSAESGDYDGSADALTGTVTFAPGQLSQTVTIHSVEDSLDEGDETVTVDAVGPDRRRSAWRRLGCHRHHPGRRTSR